MKIERTWAMPNKNTFTIQPISQLLVEEKVGFGKWIDPFAGFHSPAQLTNDLNPDAPTLFHEDARDWLQEIQETFDGGLFDPPYSISQAVEVYKGFGKEVLGRGPGNMGYWADIKNELGRLIRPGGKVICCGWSSQGLGKSRGFSMTRVLLVPHGGSKNDTIVTVEIKEEGYSGYVYKDVLESLTPEQAEDLGNWMSGQTMALRDTEDGLQSIIYAWDYDRWLKGLPVID